MVDWSDVYIMNKRVSFKGFWGLFLIVSVIVHQQTASLAQKLLEIPSGMKQAFNYTLFVRSKTNTVCRESWITWKQSHNNLLEIAG